MVLINTRTDPLFQAPGLDLFAPVLPSEWDSGCTTVLYNSAIIVHTCLPPSMQLASIQGIPTPPSGGLNKLIPGTGYSSNPANCTNSTDASPMTRLYISVSTYSYDMSLGAATTATTGFTGYSVWARNATFLCESSLSEECVARLGTVGCFALVTAVRRNGTGGGATAVGGWNGGGLAPRGGSGGGSSALLLGAVLGAALGGFALGAVAGMGLAWRFAALRRRRRDVRSSSSGDLQIDAATAAVSGGKASTSIGKRAASALGLVATAGAGASRGNRAAFAAAAAAAANAFSSMSSREPSNLRTTGSGGSSGGGSSSHRAGSLDMAPVAATAADDDEGDDVRYAGIPAVEGGQQRAAQACTSTSTEQPQQPAGSGSGTRCNHHPANPEGLGNASPPLGGGAPAGPDAAGAASTNPFLTEAGRMAAAAALGHAAAGGTAIGTAATPGKQQQAQQAEVADDCDDEWLGLIAASLAAEVSVPVTPFTPHRSDLVMGVHVQDMPLQLQAQQAAAQQGGPDAAYCTAGSAWPHESEQMQQQAGSAAGSDAAPSVSATTAGAAAGAAVQITSVVLGAGAYGRVVEGLYRGQRVAVKLIKDVLIPLGMHHIHNMTSRSSGGSTAAGGRADMRQARAFAQEVEILARCRHPNIVQLLAANLNPPRVCLVMERMDCSLAHLLRPHGPGTLGRLLPLPILLHIATDIARGLDLKPGNVLINNRESDCPTAKLTDFGLSRLRSTDAATVNPEVGTPTHMAPEVFDTTNFVVTDKVDIYALGVIMWELVTGCVPWAGSSAMEIAVAINIKRAYSAL
ncbi:hypothetical protein HXX76_012150 [Chlamydomonas incerta]|uniref:Protein kinase domain-containing protein n=1 Tax=Chlamydomonas incerta TaxID=51695 RepID=A0A835VW96_CHLIN|nr:hypothetical protein HXX76_012150 [Chlamydomonas incerta]|eukprot:KAG2427829.1 hypothetical protein HXX76_012150 [Chlamydomonas incerta]